MSANSFKLDPLNCPHRIRKAETVLRNRTDRISIAVTGVQTDLNTQAILRTAESVGVQNIYNLTTTNVKVSTMVHNITKGSHSFISIINTTPLQLLDEHCLGIGQDKKNQDVSVGEIWYASASLDPKFFLFESNLELYHSLIDEQKYFINGTITTGRDHFYVLIKNNKITQYFSPLELLSMMTGSEQSYPQSITLNSMPQNFIQHVNNDDDDDTTVGVNNNDNSKVKYPQKLQFLVDDNFYQDIMVVRAPLPLVPSVFGRSHISNQNDNCSPCHGNKDDIARREVFNNQRKSLIESVYHNITNNNNNNNNNNNINIGLPPQSFDPYNTCQNHSNRSLFPFPQKVIIIFDPGFSNINLQLLATRHVHIPSKNNHIFSQSTQAAIYMDRLLSLSPESIGNINTIKRNELRRLWYRSLAKNEKNYQIFLQWAKFAENGAQPHITTPNSNNNNNDNNESNNTNTSTPVHQVNEQCQSIPAEKNNDTSSTIPLLTTLRMDLIAKWWNKTGRAGGINNAKYMTQKMDIVERELM